MFWWETRTFLKASRTASVRRNTTTAITVKDNHPTRHNVCVRVCVGAWVEVCECVCVPVYVRVGVIVYVRKYVTSI